MVWVQYLFPFCISMVEINSSENETNIQIPSLGGSRGPTQNHCG